MWLLVTLWHKVTLPFESTISSMNCTISITFTLPWSGVQAVERLQILKRVWWRWVEIPGRVCSALCNVHMTRSQNNDTFLLKRVLKILTACRILQILIAWCQIKGEIHSFPTKSGSSDFGGSGTPKFVGVVIFETTLQKFRNEQKLIFSHFGQLLQRKKKYNLYPG